MIYNVKVESHTLWYPQVLFLVAHLDTLVRVGLNVGVICARDAVETKLDLFVNWKGLFKEQVVSILCIVLEGFS